MAQAQEGFAQILDLTNSFDLALFRQKHRLPGLEQ
jgi:hypothetical protein